MKSLTNGLVCLRMLAQHDGKLPVGLVGKELKLPRSSAYRLLATLAAEGFLRPGADAGTYAAGPELLAIGSLALARIDVREIALPHMRRLSEQTTHSVYLMIRSGFEAVCIELVPGNDGLHLNVGLGARRHLHCSGIAKVFLPSLSEVEIERYLDKALPRFTSSTTTDGAKLRKQAAEIERNGFAMTTGEFVVGARSIGVPIHNHQGKLIAALGLGGSQQKLSDQYLPKVLAATKHAAAAISEEFGFASDPAAPRRAKRKPAK
jgi:IclR family transcriptional regulator, KDG regulon repressor